MCAQPGERLLADAVRATDPASATSALHEAWYDAIDAGSIASCYPQRTEFLCSARNATEYDEIVEMFVDLYPDLSVSRNAGRWIEAAQRRMAHAGEHRSASSVDLMIAATAAQRHISEAEISPLARAAQ